MILKNQRGQGLIEYVIIVALMGCAAIGIVEMLNGTVQTTFARVITKLQDPRGRALPQFEKLRPADYRKKDLSHFMESNEGGGRGVSW